MNEDEALRRWAGWVGDEPVSVPALRPATDVEVSCDLSHDFLADGETCPACRACT